MVSATSCIGCQACVDMCPTAAISFSYDSWGEGKITLNKSTCIKCGLCDRICPAHNRQLNSVPKTVYAVVSNKHRKTGSSGGFFYCLAQHFINNNGIVIGAAFDEDLKLVHKSAHTVSDIPPLCKSKYLHSDMSGVYRSLKELLSKGNKVMYVGTPCQVSAVKNLFGDKYPDRLLLVDFLCHGTGTQKVFDACIRSEELKQGGKITDFQFRAKSRNAEHSFSYKLKKGNAEKTISGYPCEFPFYNSYLNYTIFNDACYSCQYAQNSRTGDITLGDFWGISKYNKKLMAEKGVSMICINTEKGKQAFDEIRNQCKIIEYPLEYASSNNQSFNEPVPFPKRKKELADVLRSNGEDALVKALSCPNTTRIILYTKCPKWIKKLYNRLRGRI